MEKGVPRPMTDRIAPATRNQRQRWRREMNSQIRMYWHDRGMAKYRPLVRDAIKHAKFLRDYEFKYERVVNTTSRFLMLKK